ncbi:hypothetical protein CLV63_12268 [Murinocardiopsis flavida]|uniref:TIGR01777 family protein n=1 Tax=Murinocardiopsis flavida TaxID=645275 RepID=A0A2P8CZZ5_9ACTN|nr:TIGR01777 family oxidoreductase [Murinocardiopsis flavida]PSK90534.1 hypothetical protein CLV63_12268 [Murinocardiopsis flavida]
MRIAITGSSGLVGSALARSLRASGHDVLHLVRRPARTVSEVTWDPGGGYVDSGRLAGCTAVVHLAGASIGPARWTARYKRRIRDSRASGTRTIAAALAAMAEPPRLLSGSAVGFYGDTGNHAVTETADPGQGFLADVVVLWEGSTAPAADAGIPVTLLRSGIVLAAEGGLLGTVLPLFKAGLGGRLGSGTQYISWVALADEVGAIRFLLEHPEIDGPVNLTAPEPVTNAAYTAAIGTALGRPTPLPVPGFAMRAALGGFADEAALVSQRAVPQRLLDAGYSFTAPDIGSALSDIV